MIYSSLIKKSTVQVIPSPSSTTRTKVTTKIHSSLARRPLAIQREVLNLYEMPPNPYPSITDADLIYSFIFTCPGRINEEREKWRPLQLCNCRPSISFQSWLSHNPYALCWKVELYTIGKSLVQVSVADRGGTLGCVFGGGQRSGSPV